MNSKQDGHSHIFLIRFWSEEVGKPDERKELCGRVQHVISGEARTFHAWPALIDLLLEMAETEGVGAQIRNNKTRET
jgi:hypothetical protein